MFQIDGKYYIIEDTGGKIGETSIYKLITLFKDDEFKGSGDNIFTYVIGTEYIINAENKTITRNSISNECDINKMHIWSKPAVSIQEIETKHGIIIQQLVENYNKIINAFKSLSEVDRTLLHDNAIDQVYYAGEMKYENDTLYVNFLSGTFMFERVDCKNPPIQMIECITNFFRNKLGINNVIIDTSCETFITEKMMIEQLNNYVNSGIKAYVFDNKNDAMAFKDKKNNIAKHISKKRMNENKRPYLIKNNLPTDNLDKISEEIDMEINKLELINPTRYFPQSYGGRKTRKHRNKTRRNKTRRNKIRRNKMRINTK